MDTNKWIVEVTEKLQEVTQFEEMTGKSIEIHLQIHTNYNNTTRPDKDGNGGGIMMGIAHTQMCANNNVNQAMLKAAMVECELVEKLEQKMVGSWKVRKEGFMQWHGLEDDRALELSSFVPAFYVYNNESIYWNEHSKFFPALWNHLMEYTLSDGRAIKDSERNTQLKEKTLPLGYGMLGDLREWGLEVNYEANR